MKRTVFEYVFSTKLLIGTLFFPLRPTGEGPPFTAQRQYFHFSVILRTQVLVLLRESIPAISAVRWTRNLASTPSMGK